MFKEQRSLINRAFWTGTVGITLVSLLTPAAAVAGWQPDPDSTAPTSNTGSVGRRDECYPSENGLTLTPLAPHQIVGETISTHPTVSWYVPRNRAALKVEVQIFEPVINEDGLREYKTVLTEPHELSSTGGVETYTLPQSEEGLRTGTEYVWEVSVYCNESNRYAVLTPIKVIDASARLSEPLPTDRLEQAEQLAENGIWYDALAAISNPPVSLMAESQSLWSNFLEGLANSEAKEEPVNIPEGEDMHHSEKLRELSS